jgi:hypothetical protein
MTFSIHFSMGLKFKDKSYSQMRQNLLFMLILFHLFLPTLFSFQLPRSTILPVTNGIIWFQAFIQTYMQFLFFKIAELTVFLTVKEINH